MSQAHQVPQEDHCQDQHQEALSLHKELRVGNPKSHSSKRFAFKECSFKQ